ncbi:MAG: hypothetical protein ACLVJ6_11140 [Merdibacter sp.]
MGGIMASYATRSYEAGGLVAPHVLPASSPCWSRDHPEKDEAVLGKPAPFVMELPQYHIPSVKTVLMHAWERLKGFIIKAGTILFLACVVMVLRRLRLCGRRQLWHGGKRTESGCDRR